MVLTLLNSPPPVPSLGPFRKYWKIPQPDYGLLSIIFNLVPFIPVLIRFYGVLKPKLTHFG